jgi:hypothetical protein
MSFNIDCANYARTRMKCQEVAVTLMVFSGKSYLLDIAMHPESSVNLLRVEKVSDCMQALQNSIAESKKNRQ